MTAIAIYDLDRTVLRRASFTPFLLFAARRHQPWRLALAPAWIAAMALYKLRLFSRRALKQFGLHLLLGQRIDAARLEAISDAFARKVVPAWVAPGAARAIADDRREGQVLVLATAAMEFYARPIAERLGFDHVLASRSVPLAQVPSACRMDGANCYGAEKPRRLTALLEQQGWARPDCTIRFYTDSASDAPLLDAVEQPVLVNPGPRARRIAARRGWRVARF